MSEYDDIYEVDYVCPKCGGPMEFIWNDENVGEYNFDGKVLVCEDCGFMMPKDAYGFSSEDEYKAWYDEAYEKVYHD